jgi:CRP/FNR family transcriptional regulator, cyclic AMP receptor protein
MSGKAQLKTHSLASVPEYESTNLFSQIGSGILYLYPKNEVLFRQGEDADALFYIHKGNVKLTVLSPHGKEAVIAILGSGQLAGEECLGNSRVRTATVCAITDCSVTRIAKEQATRMIREQPDFSELMLSYVLSRNRRIEEDLVDQLSNSSEKRLARALLRLAEDFGEQDQQGVIVPKINQETLAEMIGTTRSRVSFFMAKFRKLGYIDQQKGLLVRRSLSDAMLLE